METAYKYLRNPPHILIQNSEGFVGVWMRGIKKKKKEKYVSPKFHKSVTKSSSLNKRNSSHLWMPIAEHMQSKLQ